MAEKQQFPQNWQIGQDYDPNTHLMKLERYDRKAQRMVGSDYLNVQNRLLWFIRDQRALIVAGLAKVPYTIQTELVEMDRERGWAHYKTYIRDVLGNEATMYGSEAAASFPDYAEKASTKSLGRALLLLGYGTAFAPEIDEGERIVDAPVDQRQPATAASAAPAAPARAAHAPAAPTRSKQQPAGATTQPPNGTEPMASDRQLTSIRMLCAKLGRSEPDPTTLTFSAARDLLTQLSRAYSEARQAS